MVTEESIVSRAAAVAAEGGFEAVTVSRLAGELGVGRQLISESFDSDESLQQSIVLAGADVFRQHVTEPAASAPEGIDRLRSLLARWVDYAESESYRGGFVGGAADLPSHIRDLIARIARRWLDTLAEHAREAIEQGALPAGTDPRQVAFEVHGLVQEANWSSQVLGDHQAYDRARRGIDHRLGRSDQR